MISAGLLDHLKHKLKSDGIDCLLDEIKEVISDFVSDITPLVKGGTLCRNCFELQDSHLDYCSNCFMYLKFEIPAYWNKGKYRKKSSIFFCGTTEDMFEKWNRESHRLRDKHENITVIYA